MGDQLDYTTLLGAESVKLGLAVKSSWKALGRTLVEKWRLNLSARGIFKRPSGHQNNWSWSSGQTVIAHVTTPNLCWIAPTLIGLGVGLGWSQTNPSLPSQCRGVSSHFRQLIPRNGGCSISVWWSPIPWFNSMPVGIQSLGLDSTWYWLIQFSLIDDD